MENEPLKIYLALSDIDRRREKPLETSTVNLLARSWRNYSAQYPLLNEMPLADATIVRFLERAQAVNQIKSAVDKADTAGMLQSLLGLWQVFARHGLIPPPKQIRR